MGQTVQSKEGSQAILPRVLREGQNSVFDNPLENALQAIFSLLGGNDPTSQVLGLMNPMETGPMGGAAKAIGRLIQRVKNPIKAFHGSPHDFEQFSLSKIGTGEGAQAYGHGLYFAEREGVAREYQQTLSTPTVKVMGQDQPIPQWRPDLPPDQRVIRRLADSRAINPTISEADNIARVRKNLEFEQAGKFADDETKAKIQQELDILAETEKKGVQTDPGGRMYEVAIHADPESFLDWDKPLSQQSEAVKEKLRQFGLHGPRQTATGATYDPPGQVAYDALKVPRTTSGNDAAATAAMREAGIPGIKYLDQGSRWTPHDPQSFDGGYTWTVYKPSGGSQVFDTLEEANDAIARFATMKQGTHNYVVFDDSIIEVLRKYGLLPPIAGAALHGTSGEAQAQPVGPVRTAPSWFDEQERLTPEQILQRRGLLPR